LVLDNPTFTHTTGAGTAGSPFLFSGSGTFIFPGDAASFTSVTAVAGSDSTLDFNNAIPGAVDGLDQPSDFITLAAAGNVVTETISPGGGRLAKTVTGAVSGTNFQHLQFDFSSDADPARGTPQLTVNAGTDLSHSTR